MRWQIIDSSKENKIKVLKNQALGIVFWVNKPGDYRLEVELVSQGATALILGLVQGKMKESIKILTETRHLAANTHAETIIYGIGRDESEIIVRGMIKIEKAANQVTDFLTERIILLSAKTKAMAEPSLEIKANEVRASHAATVAPIDEEQVYYLMSRGVSREEAEKLIIDGFFQTVVNKIDDDKIRKQICLKLKQ